ncbi:DEAD/DEAH box helicase [Paenibacillus sp. y28]|uniref:DEAD/DEAH box helicase n=1 Tax=Paenibacillus sp. y28 TaxID=3129110 RepID=UPI003015B20A
MISSAVVQLHLRWLPTGNFFLWGILKARRYTMAAPVLKHHLFAWHEGSSYGTFVDCMELDHKDGLLLPPLLALELLSAPEASINPFFSVEWDEEGLDLLRIAPNLMKALESGSLLPDFEKWKSGQIGWKLPFDVQSPLPYLEEWLERLLEEKMQRGEAMYRGLAQLKAASAILDDRAVPEELWRDENDWLRSIGWLEEESPFRTGLRLSEPVLDGPWLLEVVLQDKENPEQLVLCSPFGRPYRAEDAPEAWLPSLDEAAEAIRKWTLLVPWLQEGEARRHIRTALTDSEAWLFLSEASLRLVQFGYPVLLPAWWEQLTPARTRLKAKIKSSVGSPQQALFGLDQIVQFDWRLAIGDTDLTEEDMARILAGGNPLVRAGGQWVLLDASQLEQVRRILGRVKRKDGLSLRDVLELHLLGSPLDGDGEETAGSGLEGIEVELNRHLLQLIDQLREASSLPLLTPPEGFRGQLRRYQVEGASWLLFLRRFGLGGCLADDMGLGKTVQFITYLLSVKEGENPSSPALLICPTSVIGNWQKELERFAPELTVHLHYGPGRAKGDDFLEATQEADVVICSYALAHLDEAELGMVEWNAICLDEAQNIKNAYTKQSSAVRRLKARHRIAMTGTPMENRLTELWSIFDFINSGYLGSLREFTARFVAPIERGGDRSLIEGLQRFIRPFLLRRVKHDPAIELDLPEKQESKAYVSLTPEQAAMYEQVIQDLFAKLEQLSPMERRGQILAVLTKLKQLCDHPALYSKEQTEGFTEERSVKMQRLLEMIAELRTEGDRCLVFTQFVEMGHQLQAWLSKELGEPILFLHGGCPKQERDAIIERFQAPAAEGKETCGVLILSLKAGGVGLNLTAANHVFHFDRWWNPAVENQATDRAFRIGQTKHVQVHKFVTLGTLEERIDEMIERKQGLSQHIVGGGEQWITELSASDLRELFKLRREWVNT